MTTLSGEHWEQLEAALLAAFPNESDLKRLVRVGLGENPGTVLAGNRQADRVYALIEWADARGKLPALLHAACEERPDNQALHALAGEQGIATRPPGAAPRPPAPTGSVQQERPRHDDPAPSRASGNPFTPGRSVPPERFIGRRRERRAILGRIETMTSVSLVGEARIGKTSLLRYLEQNIPDALQAHGTYIPIYCSMNEHTLPTFCADVRDRLVQCLDDGHGAHDSERVRALRALAQTAESTMRDMVHALEWCEQHNLSVVLLLDEFKDILRKPHDFNAEFSGALRSLYDKGTIALVLATRQPLTEIAGLTIYDFNGLWRIDLGTMPPDEAEVLLRRPENNLFTDAEVHIGLRAGRNHPLRLQWAGDLLYCSKRDNPALLHTPQGDLRDTAFRRLEREVQMAYDDALALSAHPPDTTPRRFDPLATLGRITAALGDGIDTATARLYGVVVVVVLLLIAAALAGWIPPAQLRALWILLTGGS